MNKILKKIHNIISICIVVVLVTLAVLMVGVRLIGFDVYTVLSGSMEPEYPVGSMIYVKEAEYTELEPGDVITFMVDENIIATHRIVEVLPDKDDSEVIYFRTKGDANEYADGGLVHCKNIIGTPVFTIPYMGYFADFIQKPPGLYVGISVTLLLLMVMFLPDILSDKEPKRRKDNGV